MADNYPSPRQTGPYDTPGNTPANAAVRDVTVDPTAPPRPLPGTTTFSPIPVSGQHGEGAAQPLPPIAPAGPSPAVRPLTIGGVVAQPYTPGVSREPSVR